MTATSAELLLIVKARPLAEEVLHRQQRHTFFDSMDGVPSRLCNLLMRSGYVTREAVAAATDADILECRHIGIVGLCRIRAVVPYAGGDA